MSTDQPIVAKAPFCKLPDSSLLRKRGFQQPNGWSFMDSAFDELTSLDCSLRSSLRDRPAAVLRATRLSRLRGNDERKSFAGRGTGFHQSALPVPSRVHPWPTRYCEGAR